jgi:hypothetical protein
LLKTNSKGDSLWAKKYGTLSNDSCNSVAVCKDKGFLIGGNRDTLNKHKLLFYKTDSAGIISTTVFEKAAPGNRSISRMIQSNDGGCVLLANTDVGGFGGPEIRMDKYHTGGWWVWGRSFGGTLDDEGYDVIQAVDSGYALVGYTASYGMGPDNVFISRTNSLGLYPTAVNIYVSVPENDALAKSISLYPNPCHNQLTISSSDLPIHSLRILNMMGEVLQQVADRNNYFSLDMEPYTAGMYFIEMQLKEKTLRRKIMVEK